MRELAVAHAVNPMTISKAYSLLEAEGLLARNRGKPMTVVGTVRGASRGQTPLNKRLEQLDPLIDQRLAAALMMGEGMIVFLALAVWLGARALADAERRQSLLDRGNDPRTAARAVRYGR